MDNWLETKKIPAHLIAVGGLVCKESRVLLIRSEKRGWEFPGGLVEQGESLIDGLKREISEETGIMAEPVHLVDICQNLTVRAGYGPLEGVPLPPTVHLDFICAWQSGTERLSAESAEIGWFTTEEAREMVKYPGLAERLSNMLNYCGDISLSAYEKADGMMSNFRQKTLAGPAFADLRDSLSVNDYQRLALRTLNPELSEKDVLINGVMGLCGESGEAIDLVKKHLAQGHPLNREALAKELGDVAWYLAETAHAIGYDLETILTMNIEKLRARYPGGFDTAASLNRSEG